jgi:hypothetical protein
VVRDGVDPRALVDYLTGFSKINNRDRFRRDAWEGEATFDRTFKPSATAAKKRVQYLYPPIADEAAARDRYFEDFSELVRVARQHGARVTIAKFPLLPRFKAMLENEAEFDAALQSFAALHGAELVDFSDALPHPDFYADTDHLNRAGVSDFFERHLMQLFMKEL